MENSAPYHDVINLIRFKFGGIEYIVTAYTKNEVDIVCGVGTTIAGAEDHLHMKVDFEFSDQVLDELIDSLIELKAGINEHKSFKQN